MSEIGALPKSLLRTIIEVLGTSLNLVASSCQSFRMVARHIPRTLRQMNTHQMVMARPFLTSRDLLEVGLMLARCAGRSCCVSLAISFGRLLALNNQELNL